MLTIKIARRINRDRELKKRAEALHRAFIERGRVQFALRTARLICVFETREPLLVETYRD